MIDFFYNTQSDNLNFIIREGKTYTYKEIKSLIAGEIEKIKPLKNKVIITGTDNFDFIIKFFASVFSGKTIYLISDEKRLDDFTEEYDVLKDKNYKTIEEYEFPKINSDEIVINFYTSGSSGNPKNIKKSLFNLLQEGKDLKEELNLTGNDRFVTVSTTTMCHLFGMTFHFMFSLANHNIIDTKTLNYPDKYNIDNSILVSTPTFLDTMRKHEIKPLVPPKYIFSAGSKLEDNTFEYIKTFSKVVEIYGSTESGVIGYRTDYKNNTFYKFKNVEIIPKGDNTEILSDYAYGGKTEISDKLEVNGNNITIKCRTDRILKIYEKRISAPELEENLKKNQFCEDTYMLKIGEKLGCVVVLNEEGKNFLQKNDSLELIKFLKSHLRKFSTVVPQKWKFLDEIPKNRLGKIDLKFIEHIFNLKFSIPIILDKKLKDDSIIYKLLFHKNCKFFKGHFDNFNITPGVVQLYLAKEFANKHFGLSIGKGQWKRIKFTNIIKPNSIISLQLTKTDNNLNWEYFSSEKKYSSGVFSCDNIFKEQEE